MWLAKVSGARQAALTFEAELLAEFADERVLRPLARDPSCRRETPIGPRGACPGLCAINHPPVDVDEGGRDDQKELHER